MISVEEAANTLFSDFVIDQKLGYDKWLFEKVNRTLERVASGETKLSEHTARCLLKDRLEAPLRKPA